MYTTFGAIEEGRGHVYPIVTESYQNYQNWAVRNQLHSYRRGTVYSCL
jgi:hypothetical protein